MKKLLYVEDDAINAFVIERLLRNDFFVSRVEDGEQCLELIVKEWFDVILLDINLGKGKIDGIETLKRIRTMERYKTTPVFAVTSYAMPEDEERFLEEGFDAYFPKPVNRHELLKRIHEFLA